MFQLVRTSPGSGRDKREAVFFGSLDECRNKQIELQDCIVRQLATLDGGDCEVRRALMSTHYKVQPLLIQQPPTRRPSA